MKIVIDIPDDLVNKINNSDADDAIRVVRWYESTIAYAVKNGIILEDKAKIDTEHSVLLC